MSTAPTIREIKPAAAVKGKACALGLALGMAWVVHAPGAAAGEANEWVGAHNRWRSQAGAPPLHWSPTLAETAQAHADFLKSSQGCRPVHSAADLGENLFWASPIRYSDGSVELQPVTPTQAVDGWGGEKADFDHAANRCAPGKVCGHYTQLVWKSTSELGCGKAVCPDSSQIWVCNYRPAGNIIGQRPD